MFSTFNSNVEIYCTDPVKTVNTICASAQDEELEITGYTSDGEDVGATLTSSKLDSEIFPLQSGEGSKKSVSDWLKSAQAMLQTPQKPTDRQSKTPEDSAKKKRKFKRFELCSWILILHTATRIYLQHPCVDIYA